MSDYSGSRFESAKRGAGVLLSGALSATIIVGGMLAVMWVVEGFDFVLHGALDYQFGIHGWNPAAGLDAGDLVGIVTSPFMHIGFGHLIANSLPLLILGVLAGMRDLRKFLWATGLIILIGGVGTLLSSGPNTLTVGASGLVFGYFGYILARGLFNRNLFDILVAVGVGIAYSGILVGVLPIQEGISWQGHLFGLIGGVVAGWTLRRKRELPAARTTAYPY